MTLVKDPHHALEILGLSRGASREEITARYRELAKKYHPDFYQTEDIPEELREHATEKIKDINEAYRLALEALHELDGSALSSSGFEIAWKFDATHQVFGPPVIADGVIYFCTRGPVFGYRDGSLFALDLATGKERWRFRTSSEATSTVSVVDGVAYFGGTDGHLYAVDVNTPDELWRVKTQDPVLRTPVVADGMVFSQHFAENTLTGLDTRTGKPKWNFKTAGQVAYGPAIADGTAYFSTLKAYLYSVDIKTQKLKWRVKLRDFSTFEPVICNDLVLIQSSLNSVIALDSESGHERWTQSVGPMSGMWTDGIAIGDGMVFAASADCTYENAQLLRSLWALKTDSGEIVWESITKTDLFYTPVFHDGIVYTSSLFGPICAFDAKSGRKLWDFDFQKWTYRLAAHEGTVYVGVWGELYALKPAKPLSEEPPTQEAEARVLKIPRKKKRIRAK
jgi:outer membrane protein assembly factor BamB